MEVTAWPHVEIDAIERFLSLTFPEERGHSIPHRATWGSAKAWSGGRSEGKAQARAFIVLKARRARQRKQFKGLAVVNNVDGLWPTGWPLVIWYLAPV